jgi:hypothetical protein
VLEPFQPGDRVSTGFLRGRFSPKVPKTGSNNPEFQKKADISSFI